MVKEIKSENNKPFIKLVNGGILKVAFDDEDYKHPYTTDCPVCLRDCRKNYHLEVEIVLTKYRITISEYVDTSRDGSGLVSDTYNIFATLLRNIILIQTFTEEDFYKYMIEFTEKISPSEIVVYDIKKQEYIVEENF